MKQINTSRGLYSSCGCASLNAIYDYYIKWLDDNIVIDDLPSHINCHHEPISPM